MPDAVASPPARERQRAIDAARSDETSPLVRKRHADGVAAGWPSRGGHTERSDLDQPISGSSRGSQSAARRAERREPRSGALDGREAIRSQLTRFPRRVLRAHTRPARAVTRGHSHRLIREEHPELRLVLAPADERERDRAVEAAVDALARVAAEPARGGRLVGAVGSEERVRQASWGVLNSPPSISSTR